ncbi:hypothetical protein A5717_26140 [Mycolicibacterium porcinum]|uniref:hypothetical protein n=1 Tax=Mycolicibacterium porcinum TaxID=39693 RepID=UPI00080B9C3E|nr:hypothetical protein [Mycolicibacterium porcinum]OCB09258.1 hypothetical protein A5717_26140 [Mycolicibacterium porcinum]
MAGAITPLGDCEFTATPNRNGLYVGRCRQYLDLRSKPRKDKLDAIDDIVALASEKIRDLDLAAPKVRSRA